MKTLTVFIFAMNILCAWNGYATPQVTHSPAKINLNQSTVASLIHSFKGIGKKRAAAIVQYRNTHGAFGSVSDLSKVRGLGPMFVKKHLAQLESVYTVR